MSKAKKKTPQQNKPKQNKQVTVLAAVFAVAVIIMIVALFVPKEAERGEFAPPAFDSSAVTGTPEVPEGLGYSAPFQEGMAYRFAVCGNVLMDGKQALVYFTNPVENDTWTKLRVYDESGNVLGETGLIKPGEYVQYVMLDKELAPGTPIKLKIMGYEPDTYLSAGSVVLNTQIGGTSK